MVSRAKRRDIVDMLGDGAVEAMNLAVPLVKAIPLVGSTVEGCLQAVLYIISVKEVRRPHVLTERSDPCPGGQDEEGGMPPFGRPCHNDHSCHHH